MSFGFSAGDFIAVGQLTWKVYKSCKGAPGELGEFTELSRELSSLHMILHELEDEAKSPTSLLNRRGTGRKAELETLIGNLDEVLRQIGIIVERYHSLGRDQKKAWDRVRFAGEDLANLRGKLTFHIGTIELFISSLSASALARIEGILDELVKDVKAGKKEPSEISAVAEEEGDEAAWSLLERKLIGDGITKVDVERYKDDIREYLVKLIQANMSGDVSTYEQHFSDVDTSRTSLDSLQERPIITDAGDRATALQLTISSKEKAPAVKNLFEHQLDDRLRVSHYGLGHVSTLDGYEVLPRGCIARMSRVERDLATHTTSHKPEAYLVIKTVSIKDMFLISKTFSHPPPSLLRNLKDIVHTMGLEFQLLPNGDGINCSQIVHGRYRKGPDVQKFDIWIVKIPFVFLYGFMFGKPILTGISVLEEPSLTSAERQGVFENCRREILGKLQSRYSSVFAT